MREVDALIGKKEATTPLAFIAEALPEISSSGTGPIQHPSESSSASTGRMSVQSTTCTLLAWEKRDMSKMEEKGIEIAGPLGWATEKGATRGMRERTAAR